MYYNPQKSNFIEFKTLESTLNSKEKAKYIYRLRHELTPLGFEHYIKWLYTKDAHKVTFTNYKLKADGGIDLKSTFKNKKYYFQCKKYLKNYWYKGKVGVSDVRNFYGGVVSEYNGNIQDKNVEFIFITTGYYTYAAKEFCKENNIHFYDYKYLANKYTLKEFKTYINSIEVKTNKRYVYQDKQLSFDPFQYSFDDLKSRDIFEYLKNIRDNIADAINKEDIKTYEIFKDITLEDISKLNICDTTVLTKYANSCSYYEKKHVLKYQREIIKGLTILKS